MTRQVETLIISGSIIVLALLYPLGSILWWLTLWIAAWYIKRIPEKRLPYAAFFATHQPTFYIWMSGFLTYWLQYPMMIFFGILVVGTLGWGVFTLKLIPLAILPSWLNLLTPIWVQVLAIFFLLADYFSFGPAKFMFWDAYIWQAEPTARLLVGGEEEYNKLSAEDQKRLKRHIAEASIGINKGTWLVTEGKAKLVNPPTDTFAKFGGPGVLVVQEGHAVVLEQKGAISGVKGIGVHFLKPFERVNLVVYLAMQGEHFEIGHIVTKDKVVIEKMELYIYHKVDSGDKSRKNGMYPFDIRVILEKVWTPKGAEKEDKSANLGEAVLAVANTAVRDVVAKYDLADVITATGEVRKKIKAECCEAIERVTDFAMGIKISVVDIGAITIPVDAQKKLLDRWLMDWESEIERIKVGAVVAKAEADYHSKIAKAEATKIATMVEGEGIAYALRAREIAKAEGAAEKIRQVGAVKGYLDNESFLGLIKYVFGEEFYRTLAEFQNQQMQSLRSVPSESPQQETTQETLPSPPEPKQD